MGCEFALPVARSNPTYIGLGPGSEDALPQTSGPRELCIFSISKTFMFEAMSIPVVDLCLPMHRYLDSTQLAPVPEEVHPQISSRYGSILTSYDRCCKGLPGKERMKIKILAEGHIVAAWPGIAKINLLQNLRITSKWSR